MRCAKYKSGMGVIAYSMYKVYKYMRVVGRKVGSIDGDGL